MEHLTKEKIRKRADLFTKLADILEELSQELCSPQDLCGDFSEGLPMLSHFAKVARNKAAVYRNELNGKGKDNAKHRREESPGSH